MKTREHLRALLAAPPAARARIVVVDDQEANLRLLRHILHRAGYPEVETTSDPHAALALCERFQPDLVLLDLHMPRLDGFAVLEQLRRATTREIYLPVLMLTGDATTEAKLRALASGATDFLAKPFDATEVMLRIRNLLETRSLYRQLRNQNTALESRIRERTRDLEDAQREILERLADAGEFRDDDTGRHTHRVGELAAAIARELGLSAEMCMIVRQSAPLHDVGKIGIPDHILLKAGPLTAEEHDVMKSHTTIGARILGNGRSSLIRAAEEIALSHHERWDGTGYPQGLAGASIPLVARIVAVADVFDALTHDRPYRPAWPTPRAAAEIEAGRGTHFAPEVVDAFLRLRARLQPA